MSGPSPAPPASRKGRWLAIALVLALAGFTFLCWRDASRPPVRPVSGGTFGGKDVDGRLVYVSLFEEHYADYQLPGWRGWLYREGLAQTDWFSTTNRTHPWNATVNAKEYDEKPKPPESIVASMPDARRLNVTLPRLASWGADTANLSRQFEHLSFRRRAGVILGRFGGTKEFYAQFPKLPAGVPFIEKVGEQILQRCETHAAEFNSGTFDFWSDWILSRHLPMMNEHELTEHWQVRLLTTNLASFSVWSYDEVGGNGNHSHWAGENFARMEEGLCAVKLADLFRAGTGWQNELRARCVPKLQAAETADRVWGTVTDPRTEVDIFTLSPTGLQLYFNPYILASGAEGEFVVHFDYAELKDLLRTNGPALFLPHAPVEAAK